MNPYVNTQSEVSEKPLMHVQAQIVLIYYSHSDPMGTDGQTMIGSSCGYEKYE
jgi:hypothetical protein